jgi:hypothetical protein
MIKLWEVALSARLRKKGNGILPPSWFVDKTLKTNMETGLYTDNLAHELAPITPTQEYSFILFALLFFGMLVWMPVVIIALFVLIPPAIAASISLAFIMIFYMLPTAK